MLIASADKKCPFTGLVSIRGRILTGTVVSTKMHRTLIIRREYLHYIPKYARYEKRHKNLAAHVSPAFRVEEGDQVTVGQCRPLSKTVGFHCSPRLIHDTILTTGIGPIQRSPCASPNWQGGQEVQQVLRARGFLLGISGAVCFGASSSQKWDGWQGRNCLSTKNLVDAVSNEKYQANSRKRKIQE